MLDRRLPIALIASLTLAAGCGERETPPAVAVSGEASPGPGDVPLLDATGVADLMSGLRGKVVVLNIWATWCLPCVAEFPELDRFAKEFRARGVEVVAVSVDDPESRPQVKAFLAARSPSFRVVMAGGAEDALAHLIGGRYEGFLPTTYILDREGRMQKKLVGQRRHGDFAAAVAPLIGG